MTIVTKAEFEAFVAAHAVGQPLSEPDTEYSYENYVDAAGDEIAFVTLHSYKNPVYIIRDGVEHAFAEEKPNDE